MASVAGAAWLEAEAGGQGPEERTCSGAVVPRSSLEDTSCFLR